MVNVRLLFFLRVTASLQAVFSNQAFAPRPSRAGTAIPETPKPRNFLQWLKSSFLVLSCGTRLSCGDMSKSKVLERFLGFVVSYIYRMTPNEVETASVAPCSPLLLFRVWFFCASSGKKPNTSVAFEESLCAKLIGALWLINQTPQSPSENSAQDGWSYAANTPNYSSGFLLSMNHFIRSSSHLFVFDFT